MTEFVFKMLNSIGFTHPLHPIMTHLPMGMVMGFFLFGLASYFLQNPPLGKSAYHCAVLGFIGVFPTILFGYMDWQHSFAGHWMLLIKIKMALAVVLTLLLTAAVISGRKEEITSVKQLILYILCMASAVGLGFCGGQMLYG